MSHNPPVDLMRHLDSQSTALTAGVNLFRGPVRAPSSNVPVEAVFLNGDGGPPASRVFGGATEVRHPTITTIIRSNGYDSGYALAQTVYDKLQSASPSTGNVYMDVMALQSEPSFLQQDKNMHYFWSINWRVTYQTT